MPFFFETANSSYAWFVYSEDKLSVSGLQFAGNSVSRTNDPIPSGKWYWEVTAATDNNHGPAAGITLLTGSDWKTDTTGIYFFNSTNGATGYWRYWNPSDDRTGGGSSGCSDSSVLGIAFDADAGKIWFSVDGVWLESGDPGAGTGAQESAIPAGTYYASVGFAFNSTNDTNTANFGASATAYSPPTGFSTLEAPVRAVFNTEINLGYALETIQPFEQIIDLSYSQVSIQPVEQEINLGSRLEADVVWTPVVTAIHYTLKLVADGYSDLVLPMSSFQTRLRQSTPSYLQAIIPGALEYVDEIADRSNGDIIIERGLRWTDGTTQLEEIARVNFETIRTDEGAISDSATLTGHKTTTYSAPKTVNLSGAQIRSVNSSNIRYRCEIDNSLRPGDTAIINGDSIIVEYIQHGVAVGSAYMEITSG